MSDRIEQYIEWVQQSISVVQRNLSSIHKPDISIADLKEILSNRVYASLAISLEYQRYKTQLEQRKREYKVWYSEKYVEVRDEVNPTSLAGSKWISKGEIDAVIISRYADRWSSKQEEIDEIERKVSFLRTIREAWSSIAYDLNNLTKIVELEYNSIMYEKSSVDEPPRRPKRN